MPDASILPTAAFAPSAGASVPSTGDAPSTFGTDESFASDQDGVQLGASSQHRGRSKDATAWSDAAAAVDASDEHTMLRFAAGDLAAFDTLYARHEAGVWRFVRRQLRDPAIAEELLQEVWFSVVRHAPRYEPRARFKTWLYTIAHHRMVDHFRAHRGHLRLDGPAEDSDESGAALSDTLAADSAFGPLRETSRREAGSALLRAVDALPATQREAFLLQAEGDLSVDEIAAATGTNFETAKSRLRYARAALRLALKDFA